MSFCGNIPFNVWEYLLNASVQTANGCKGLNFIQVPFQSCGEPCDSAGLTTDQIVHQLFELDNNGVGGIRVIIESPPMGGSSDCKFTFDGEDVIRNYIGTAADGRAALIIRIQAI